MVLEIFFVLLKNDGHYDNMNHILASDYQCITMFYLLCFIYDSLHMSQLNTYFLFKNKINLHLVIHILYFILTS
jgi:hypothetical protein